MKRTAIVVLTWNDLPKLTETLSTFREFNGVQDMYVVDNGSTDGTREYLAGKDYQVIHHQRNTGVFTGTMSGWTYAAQQGHEFILNVQSDFPSVAKIPFGLLEQYLDLNPDVGFIRLNAKKDFPRNSATGRPIIYQAWDPVGDGFEIAKYNYHMAFHPYLFRSSFVEHFSRAPLRTERGLMAKYEELNKRGARLRPHCFHTYPCNRHNAVGWIP
jgi:glycosyltransferase involved in cell wall biosynthesis